MSSVAEQFDAICKVNLDTARQYATMSVEGAERLLQLPIEAAREFIVKGSDQFTTTWRETGFSKALADWPTVYQDNLQKANDVTRTYLETVAQAQAGFARLLQEQAALAHKNFVEGVQALASATSAGSEIATSAITHAAEPAEHKPKKAA